MAEGSKSGEDLRKEALARLAEAKEQREHIAADLEECAYFVAPRRFRTANSRGGPDKPPKDSNELMISIGKEVASDFASEVVNTFMPTTGEWVDLAPGISIGAEDARDIAEEVGEAKKVMFAAMRSSALYSCVSQTAKPDLAIGTMALWIDDLNIAEPVSVRPVPATEIEINVDCDGGIGDRFVHKKTKRRSLARLLPGMTLPKGYDEDTPGNMKKACTVTWCFWPLYRANGKAWQACILVDDKLVEGSDKVLEGEGACPMLVMRWDPDPLFAWGIGPTLQSLEDMRALDEIEALKIDNADFAIHAPFYYPDDGVMNFEAGIEPGFGYAKRPGGTANDIGSLYFGGNVDFAQFTVFEKEQRVRRLHFVDYPVQRGDTPPTATQWTDEMAMRQRRFGLPGQTFWREGPCEIAKRFLFILAGRGRLPKIEANGQVISLVPFNAAEAAKDLQEVATATRLLTTIMGMFPQVGQVAIDAIETSKNMKAKMRDEIVVIREPDQMRETVEQLAPVLGGAAGAQGMEPAP